MTMTDTTTNRAGVLKLWLLNFVANAAAAAIAYCWLLIPDAHGWQVAATAAIAACTVGLVLWLRAGTLAWFRIDDFRKDGHIWRAYRHSLRFVPAFGFWVLVFVVVAWAIWGLREFVPQTAVYLRQKLNAGPPPRNIMNDLNWLIVVIVAFLLPGLWVPIATTVAASGVNPTHLKRARRVWRRPLYWLWFCLLLSVGVYVPYKLVWWVPDLATLRQQAWSMGGRFLLAYVFALSVFLVCVWMVGIFTEREDPIEI